MLETSNKVAVHTRAQAGPTTFSPSHTEGKTRGAVLIFSRKERRKREEIAILLFLSLPCFSRKQGGGDWRLWEEERPAVWARACARPAAAGQGLCRRRGLPRARPSCGARLAGALCLAGQRPRWPAAHSCARLAAAAGDAARSLLPTRSFLLPPPTSVHGRILRGPCTRRASAVEARALRWRPWRGGGRRGLRRRSAHAGGGLGQRLRGAGRGDEGFGQPPAVGRRMDGHDVF